jgi:hypothetical protein
MDNATCQYSAIVSIGIVNSTSLAFEVAHRLRYSPKGNIYY